MKSKINEDGPQITKKLKTIEQNFFNKLNTVESSTEIFDQTLESLHRIKKDYPEHSKLANTVRNNIMIDYINHASEEQMIQLAVNCKSTFAQFEKVMKSKQIKEQKKKTIS